MRVRMSCVHIIVLPYIDSPSTSVIFRGALEHCLKGGCEIQEPFDSIILGQILKTYLV